MNRYKTIFIFLLLIIPSVVQAQSLTAEEIYAIQQSQDYKQVEALLKQKGLAKTQHADGGISWQGEDLDIGFLTFDDGSFYMSCIVFKAERIPKLIGEFVKFAYTIPKKEGNIYRMAYATHEGPDIIVSSWEKNFFAFSFESADDEQAEIEAASDADWESRVDEPDMNKYPLWNKHDGNFYVEGKLDNTYFFAFNMVISGNMVNGFYFTNPKSIKPVGVLSGHVDGDSVRIEVHVNNRTTRTFVGSIKNNLFSGAFTSGYDGKQRRFTAKMMNLGL